MADSTEISKLPDSRENVTLETKEKPSVLSQDTVTQIVKGLQSANISTSLPSRDIPMDVRHFSSPSQINPNYVQKETQPVDYIKDKEDIYKIIEEHNKKAEENKIKETKYEEFQSPIFVALLYLLFQLPFFQNKMNQVAPSLFPKDGKLTGTLSKALLFGLLFYGMQTAITYLSEV